VERKGSTRDNLTASSGSMLSTKCYCVYEGSRAKVLTVTLATVSRVAILRAWNARTAAKLAGWAPVR
jgi:hypothetical protein